MQIPELTVLLKSGAHFGHRTSKWHPNMEPYIFTVKQGVHIINLEKTAELLEKAMQFTRELASQGKTMLFVGTKHQAAPLIEHYAKSVGMPFVAHRWLGGTLTNFKTISSVARKLTKLKQQNEAGELKKYTKKEQLEFSREIERLEGIVGGIETLFTLPDAVFLVDLREEKTALRESRHMHIPVIAICDTNVDPKLVDYPIPANDDAVKSIECLVASIAAAVGQGKKEIQPEVVAAPEAVTMTQESTSTPETKSTPVDASASTEEEAEK